MMKFQSIILAVIFSVFSVSAFAETVNLNKANAATLQHYLKGIGNKKAQDIIEYRKQHSGFKSLEEIMEVKGVGTKTFEKIKKNLSLSEGVVAFTKTQRKVKKTKKDSSEKVVSKETVSKQLEK